MKKTLFNVNLLLGILWLIFNLVVERQIDTDLFSNDPLTEKEYSQKGGNKFDYYVGYAYLTSTTDQVHYGIGSDEIEHQQLFPKHLREGTASRIFFIAGLTALWLLGFCILYVHKENPIPYFIGKLFVVITTVMSFYGAYYCTVYITKFWLL
jgi:hypothetical protein